MAYQSIPQRDAVVRTLAVEEDQQRLVETLAARLNGKQLRKTLSDLEKEKRKVIPTPASFAITFGEFLWIIRPLLYRTYLIGPPKFWVDFLTFFPLLVLSLTRFGKNSWKPWFISLLVDLASRSCSYSTQLNEYETQEMYRRGFLWFFYLMRSPFFEFALGSSDASSSRFASLFNLLQRVPLLNLLTCTYFIPILKFGIGIQKLTPTDPRPLLCLCSIIGRIFPCISQEILLHSGIIFVTPREYFSGKNFRTPLRDPRGTLFLGAPRKRF